MKKTTMKSLIWALALLPLVACGDPTAVDLRDVEFAPELNVDLDLMTRTSSGLYYRDLEEGDGAAATAGQIVQVHYRGWLADGGQFDARQPPSEPFRFLLGAGQVIDGWDEGVAGMRPGGVRQLVIPPSLGYGGRPVGPIPPNSVLVFEVELVAVE